MKKIRGFTLIELLIVLAVIGIFAVIVITSLSKVRNRSNSAAITSSLRSFQTDVELRFENGYQNLCSGDFYQRLVSSVERSGGIIESCENEAGAYRIIANNPVQVSQSFIKQAYAENVSSIQLTEWGGGGNRINAIIVTRSYLGISLKKAKDLVDAGAPIILVQNPTQSDLEKMKTYQEQYPALTIKYSESWEGNDAVCINSDLTFLSVKKSKIFNLNNYECYVGEKVSMRVFPNLGSDHGI